MCQLLGVPRSSVYRKPCECPERAEFYRSLRLELATVLGANPGYGYRRARIELGRQGFSCGYKSVAKAMKEGGLNLKRKRRPITSDGQGEGTYPNLLKDATIDGPGQVWVADITYVGLPHGMAYLAVVMDIFLRKVIGKQLGERIDTALTVGALKDALSRKTPQPGWIHHSDRGSQYLSKEYVKLVEEAGGRISASKKACPYDNATMESFFNTLKKEEVHIEEYESLAHARKSIYAYIDGYYNARRMHSSLGNRSPDEFEASTRPQDQS
jgi:putative transposase